MILDKPCLQFGESGGVTKAHQFFIDDPTDETFVLDRGHCAVGLLEISAPNGRERSRVS